MKILFLTSAHNSLSQRLLIELTGHRVSVALAASTADRYAQNHRYTLSKLRIAWASWISLWRFLAHLKDLDFYKGLDEQREICIAPSASCRERVHGKRDEAMLTAVAEHAPDHCADAKSRYSGGDLVSV